MKHAVFKKNKRAYNTLKNKGSLLASMIHEEPFTSMEQQGSLESKKGYLDILNILSLH